MLKYQKAQALQQFLVLALATHPELVSRQGDRLIVKLGDVNPYTLFMSVLGSLGDDPLGSFKRFQELINNGRRLFGVPTIIFQISASHNLQKVDISEMIDSTWFEFILGNLGPRNILPNFDGVEWQTV